MLQPSEKGPEESRGIAIDQTSDHSSHLNNESSIYYTKNKKIIFWLYLLLGLIFVVSQATLVSQNWKNYETFSISDNFYLANQVSHEWTKGFIVGIQVTGSNCPDGFENAFNFSWPGTSFGCFCQVDSNNSFVLEGYCSPKLIQIKCRNVESKLEIDALIWRNSSRICVKRSSVSFKTEEKYNGKNKICGSSKSLTIMPNAEPCPFVNMTFGQPALEDHYWILPDPLKKLDPLYASYNSTSPYTFYSYPISKFAVSQYEFCLIDEDSGLTPDRLEFILLNQRKGCSDVGVYDTLDSMTEIEFYANNPDLNALGSIAGFPKPGSQIYNLGFSNMPSWTYNCRHNYDSKFSIPRALDLLNFDFFKYYYYVALGQILLYFVIGFQIFILVIRRVLKKEVYPVGYRQMYLPKDFCLALTRYLIDFICKAIVLGLLIYTSWKIFVNWNWFKSAINLGCPDKDTILIDKVIDPFRTMYQQSLVYVVAQLFIFTFVAIFDLVHFIYVYKNDLKFYLVDTSGKALVEHENKDDLEWIDKEADKQFSNFILMDQGVANNNETTSEKFRLTMAMNIFDNDRIENEPQIGKPRIVKKKKKLSLLKQLKHESKEAKGLEEFVPFSIEENSLVGLNSIQLINGERNKEDIEEIYQRDKKKLDRKKKKK